LRRFSRFAFVASFVTHLPCLAVAQPVEPGAEGKLAKLLPPEVGHRVCYARICTQQHIRSRRWRKSNSASPAIATIRTTTRRKGSATIISPCWQTAGQKDTLTSMAECIPCEGKISCGVDCQGGGFMVMRQPEDKVLLSLGELGRPRMTRGCSDSVDLESVEDDVGVPAHQDR
jgi:hypothetical protein